MWNWFQNRRYAIRAKTAKAPGKLSISPMPREDSSVVRNVSQAPQSATVPSGIIITLPASFVAHLPSEHLSSLFLELMVLEF